jgi:hypothetical protein
VKSLISTRWFALVRIWTPWLAPRHGKSDFNLDKDAVMVAFLSPKGKHLVLLALSGLNDVAAVFRHSESGQPLLHVRTLLIKESLQANDNPSYATMVKVHPLAWS